VHNQAADIAETSAAQDRAGARPRRRAWSAHDATSVAASARCSGGPFVLCRTYRTQVEFQNSESGRKDFVADRDQPNSGAGRIEPDHARDTARDGLIWLPKDESGAAISR